MNHELGSVTTRCGNIPGNPGQAGRTAAANRKASNEPRCGRTDGRREVTVKAHKGETITAADGFYVVVGHNPGVHGAVLTEALSSRFTFQFDVATDYELARSLGIDSRAITAARNLATRQANGETGWAPQLRELLAFAKVTRIFGLDTALANLAGVAPAEDRDVVAGTLAKTFGKTVAPLALGRQI